MKKKIKIVLAVIGCVFVVLVGVIIGYSVIQSQRSAKEFEEAFYDKKDFERTEESGAVEGEAGTGETADGETDAPGQPDGVIEPGTAYEVDTYIDNQDVTGRLYIYDMDYVDLALDYKEKSLQDFKDVINDNSKIGKKFKPFLVEYCENVFEKYPDVELRPFYRNLKYLEVIECTEDELLKVTMDVNSCGCYVRDEDKIYVLKDKEYKKGTWDYQVLYHEFSHCLRDSIYEDKNGKRVSIQFMGLNYYDIPNAEALNSLFAVSLFDYEEKDIAYQFQSNAHQLMIECMDNYTLSDYVNHSMTYYAQQLDAYNQDDSYALTILSLMNEQYEDYHDDSRENPQETYYPIYDYISKMYLDKHVTADMSYEEAKSVMDEMLERLLFDVPEEYHVDKDHFYTYLDEYVTIHS